MTTPYYQCARPEMFRYVPRGLDTYLDVGCSGGSFAETIKNGNANSEVWGIELFEPAAKEAEKKIDHVLNVSAEESLSLLPDYFFDCVVFNDILEHLVDPYKFLCDIRPKLKNNATIIASLPNVRHYKVLFDYLFNGEWRYTEAGVMDQTHLRFFTIKSMLRLFEEAGFSVLKQEGLSGSRKVKVRIWSWLTLGALEDIRFPQYAIVASIKKQSAK